MGDEPLINAPSYRDPRLRGFRTRSSVEDVYALIDRRVARLGYEEVSLGEAAGRVLAFPIAADASVPPFDRSAMDGHAVRGEETFGARQYSPATFQIVGRSRPGRRFNESVGPGQAVEIATGAPLPTGTDTVVPVEVSRVEGNVLFVIEATPPGRHVGQRGEDVQPGTEVLAAGRVLRAQDLGVLSALGKSRLPVIQRPAVTIVITGDELLPPGTPSRGDRIADMNSVMIAALVARDGGVPRVLGPLPDDREEVEATLAEAVQASNLVLVSGGSSTGPEDHAPVVVANLGSLDVHGVSLRPASPTGLGFFKSVPLVLLPGNPVSCLCAYDLFGGRIVRRLGGRPINWPYRAIERPLAQKLTSALGRVDYARVRIVDGCVEPMAISGASILSSTTRADGFVLVPAELEGHAAGAVVTVWLYDS